MNRRGFLSGIIAACAAPAIVRADSLMRVVPNQTIAILPDLQRFGLVPTSIVMPPEVGEMLHDWLILDMHKPSFVRTLVYGKQEPHPEYTRVINKYKVLHEARNV